MTRSRRQLKIRLAFLLLLSLAASLVAPAGAWQCDTGQRCSGAAESGCCCPEERLALRRETAASSCCDLDRAPAGSACTVADSCTETHHKATVTPPASPGSPPAQLTAAPHCRCHFALTDRTESAAWADTLRLTIAPVLTPVPGLLFSPLPLPIPVFRPREEAPRERRLCRSPLGSRAPPARTLA
jgi:hypothetical protein